METNNAMPPQNPTHSQEQAPTGPAMSNGAKNMDLYNAITKEEDEVVAVVQKKKRQSPFMFLVVLFMKITFYFDSVRRSHESVFHFLGGIWSGFMGLIYLGGIITLLLSIYSFMRLPLYLENFFSSHNLKYDSLKMADYSLSKITVNNLHDDENKYVVPQLNIHSTFADFLQGRIRTVTADGLQLNLKEIDSQKGGLENVLKVLGMLANPMESGLDLQLNAITINNAILNIEGKSTKIPVNFSMSGLYTNEAQVVIPFVVDEDFLKMDATLSVTGSVENRELDLVIKSGTLALMDHPPEELQGEVKMTINDNVIQQIQSNIDLNYGYNLKTIQADLTKGESGFAGTISFISKNTSEADANAKPLVDISLKADSLRIDEQGSLITEKPLALKINRLVRNTTLLEGIDGTLKGQLHCQMKDIACQYDLNQESSLQYQNVALRFKDQMIVIDEAGTLNFNPSANTFSWKLQDSEIKINWLLSDLNVSGYYNTPSNLLKVQADSCHMEGAFSTRIKEDNINIIVENGSYQDNNLNMSGINLRAQNLLDETAPIYFSADKALTQSPLLSVPVSVDMTYLNRQTKATIKLKDSDITMTAEGILKPLQKVFVGQFKILPFDLENLPVSLFEVSPIFSKKITNVSGQVTAIGQLNFSGSNNITGPFYVGLKDVSFNWEDTPVQNINTVVALQSLVPLVSAPNQMVSIGQIDAFIPLTNIQGGFQFENQGARLLGINATVGNEILSSNNTFIPYRKPNALLYFKSEKDFKMDKFSSYIDLSGMTFVGGTGSLAIPVDISETGASFVSATLKMNNVTLKKTTGKDAIGLFNQGNDAYMIRTGQFVFNKEMLQVDLDGWLMPMRTRKPFAKQDVDLDESLFKMGAITPVSQKITDRQRVLFQSLTGTDE